MKTFSPAVLTSLLALSTIASACKDAKPEVDAKEEPERAESKSSVKIAPEAVEGSGIKVAPAGTGALAGAVDVPAVIEMNPDLVARVSVLVPGRLGNITAKTGDVVDKGQALATFDSVELGEAQAGLAQARAALDVAQSAHQRQKELAEAGVGAKRELLEAEGALKRAQADLAGIEGRVRLYGGGSGSATTIRSPLKGEILERHATAGEIARPEEPLFIVGDLSKVWIVGRVYEQDVRSVKKGAPATLTLQAYPGRTWDGTLSYVSPTLDEKARTLAVRMEIENTDGALRPGLFGTLSLQDPEEKKAASAVVPESALQRVNDADVVFVAGKEPGEFKAAPVACGVRRAGLVEILSGIAPNDLIVTAGAFVLKSELLKDQMAAED